jgi:ribokinase
MVKIAVLASFNMDLVMRAARRPGAGKTLQGEFAMHLGGKGFNQAVAARRLGADVAAVGRVGDDLFGRRFLEALDREGIDRAGVVIDSGEGTGVASITVEPDGSNSIVQAPRANRRLDAADIGAGAAAIAGATVAMLQLETSMPAAIAFARAARDTGVVTLLNPAPAAPVPGDLLALTDIIAPNEIEARALTGLDETGREGAFSMAAALLSLGARGALITLGGDGAVACADGLRLHGERFQVPVVDTVGAGDAFCAALAVRLAEGAGLAEALRFANAAGALACTRAGAEPSMPTRSEVDALVTRGVHA